MCTGKVYYDLLAAREAKGITDVAISRCEQICPFPSDMVRHARGEWGWCGLWVGAVGAVVAGGG